MNWYGESLALQKAEAIAGDELIRSAGSQFDVVSDQLKAHSAPSRQTQLLP